MRNCLVGIEIGGTKLQIVLGQNDGSICQRHRFAVDRASGADGIRRHIRDCLNTLSQENSFDAIGVGFGGPIEWKTGAIARSHQIEGWSGFDLVAWLKSLTNVEVFADNDANVAALGEALSGAGRGFASVFYVTLGSGVGGGLVQNGRIYHGKAPGECEIGHLRLDRSGRIVENECSGWAVDSRIANLPEHEHGGALYRLTRGMQSGQATELSEALAMGDAAARRLVRETGETLAFALSHVTHLLHPEVIVVGGGLSGVGEPLRQAVERALPGFLMEVLRPGPVIRLAQLGEDAVPVGALHLSGVV